LEGILADSVQEVQQGNMIQAQQTIGRALEENHLFINAHMAAAVIYAALGDEAQLAYHQAWARAFWIRSLAPATAVAMKQRLWSLISQKSTMCLDD
jgi:hypothetical protein